MLELIIFIICWISIGTLVSIGVVKICGKQNDTDLLGYILFWPLVIILGLLYLLVRFCNSFAKDKE